MIVVENLCRQAGLFRLHEICLRAEPGQYVALMGDTGCGKTTLMECICGLRPIDGGRIRLAGRDVTHVRPADRGIGYVPQDGALFSTMTVYEHLAFALRLRRTRPSEIDRRVRELAETLGIASLLGRKPAGLSGGEIQRVALGRALSFRPTILCLDEPLSALDRSSQDRMCDLLRTITRQNGITTLHITHDAYDAQRLADRTLILANGRLTPTEGCIR